MNWSWIAIMLLSLRLAAADTPGSSKGAQDLISSDLLELRYGAEIAIDGAVEVDTSDSTVEWHEYLKTIPAKVKFSPFKSYKISYDYKVQKNGGEKTRFYSSVRSSQSKGNKNGDWWAEAPGKKGHKEYQVDIDEFSDYTLTFGVRFGGAIRIENLKMELLGDNSSARGQFSGGSMVRVISCDLMCNAQCREGGIEVNTKGMKDEWNEFYRTKSSRLPFIPGRTYQFDFDYRVKSVTSETVDFYWLFRDSAGDSHKSQEFQKWMDNPGCKGHKSFTFKPVGSRAFEFIIGVHNQGALRIENLKIKQLD